MKKISLYIASLALAAAAFTACDNEFERPPLVVPTSSWKANTTIEQLKADYWSTVESSPVTVGLTATGDSVIIKGRVCSSDESGNIFKYLMVQGEKEAIALTLDFYDIFASYKYGQEVYINATGLTIGGYSGLMCLGYGQDDRGRVARAAETIFAPHAQVDGFPSAALVDTVTVTIDVVEAAKSSAEGLQLWQSQLVRFDNVYFEDAGQEFAPDGSANGAAERYIVDESGKRIMVRNSTYADFNTDLLPCGIGSIVGILSYYGSNWQVLLNDKAGCIGFNGVMPPVFTPAPGLVQEGTSVTIACATEGAEIHYTLDGSDPTASSTLYAEAIIINENTTIKAVATKSGFDASPVVTAKYIVSTNAPEDGDGTAAKPYNVAQAKAKAIENGETSTDNYYVKGYIIDGSIDVAYGNGTWTICDNAEGVGDTFELYRLYNTDNGKFTDADAVKKGDLVVAVGIITNFKGNTPEMSKGHIVSINGDGGNETPEPAPAPEAGTIFSETFLNGDLGQFTATVETSGTWTGWRANTSNPLCAIANSYVSGANEAATAWLISPVIDLSAASSANIKFEQAYGFYFPAKQESFCTVNIRETGGEWSQLTLTAFPEKGTGNWTGWVENTLDITAFAGKKIEIAFKYVNDGKQSVAWEIRNLTVNSGN